MGNSTPEIHGLSSAFYALVVYIFQLMFFGFLLLYSSSCLSNHKYILSKLESILALLCKLCPSVSMRLVSTSSYPLSFVWFCITHLVHDSSCMSYPFYLTLILPKPTQSGKSVGSSCCLPSSWSWEELGKILVTSLQWDHPVVVNAWEGSCAHHFHRPGGEGRSCHSLLSTHSSDHQKISTPKNDYLFMVLEKYPNFRSVLTLLLISMARGKKVAGSLNKADL